MSDALVARPAPRCMLCGGEGRLLYDGLRDRLFSAPGEWSLRLCTDRGCGLMWLDPMPEEADIHKAYASYYTHVEAPARGGAMARLFAAAKRGYLANQFGYGEGVSIAERLAGLLPWLYPGRPAELDFSVMWLARGARGRLLDVGAGSGWLVAQMQALGWRAEGLDFDPAAVERARARARGLTMHCGALAEQRFPDASFDAIAMSHSIEHVHDPVAWLAEAYRILCPGGRLALATPNSASMLHRRFREHWFALDPPRHLQLFNRAALDTALRRAGFTRQRQFTSVRDADGAYLGSRAIRRRGRFDMTAPRPALARFVARMVQLREVARSARDPDAGEDLVALAVK